MATQINIKLSPEAEALLRDLPTLPDDMLAGIAKAMDKENALTVSHIQQAYESFPAGSPPVDIGTRAISGLLRQTTRESKAVVNGQRVESSIGIGVRYGAIQEFGGTIKHPAREGSVRLRTDAKGNLLEGASGGAIFAKAEHKRAREIGYRSEAYEVEMPARGMVQRGINDRLSDYSQSVSDAIVEALRGEK